MHDHEGPFRRPRAALIVVAAAIGLLAGLLGSAAPAGAGFIGPPLELEVTTGADTGPGSWRAAIEAANAADAVSEVTVRFDPGLTVELTGDVTYTGDVNLFVFGRGSTIDGNGVARPLGAPNAPYLEVDEVTFRDGQHEDEGGAVDVPVGSFASYASTFVGNTAGGDGGAVHIGGSGGPLTAATVARSTFQDNTSGGDGGAIATVENGLNIDDSTFAGNGSPDDGGAISSVGGEVQVDDSALTGNSSGEGGAIFGEQAGIYTENSTLAGNTADRGGAIANDGPSFTQLDFTTFAGNVAEVGAHLAVDEVFFGHTVLGAPSGGGTSCQTSGPVSDFYSWNADDSCGFDDSGTSTEDSDPQLLALGDWGGPTPTVHPATTSPLIDASPGDNCFGDRDQRGVRRPVGERCDIGAVEVVGPTFADVNLGHPFFLEVEWMAAEGISTGYPGAPKPTYRPSAPVTRQAMSAFLYRFAGEPDFELPTEATFADVSTTNTFFTEVEWMAAEGISTGYAGSPKPTYRPGDEVTRQAMSAFIYRYADEDDEGPATPTFTDVGTSHPFYDEIEWMADAGISTGYQPGPTYRPAVPVSRQAMSAFLYRFATTIS
jgi:predicted outer membrane repeat protein